MNIRNEGDQQRFIYYLYLYAPLDTRPYEIASRAAFESHRVNGERNVDAPKRVFPGYDFQRDFVWTKGKVREDGYVYGVLRPDGQYDY